MYDDVITLISIDNDGAERAAEVFAEPMSITRSEHYQAAAVQLHPTMQFRLRDYLDYSGETHVDYGGHRYLIERTYRAPGSDELDIVVR